MPKTIASFSQVETEVVNQMEKNGEFSGRGDPHAAKASAQHEANELAIHVAALHLNEQNLAKGTITEAQCQQHAKTLVGNAMTVIVRYCALRDISAVQAFGKVNLDIL